MGSRIWLGVDYPKIIQLGTCDSLGVYPDAQNQHPPLPSTGYNKPNANAPPVVNEMTFEKPELVQKIKKRSVYLD